MYRLYIVNVKEIKNDVLIIVVFTHAIIDRVSLPHAQNGGRERPREEVTSILGNRTRAHAGEESLSLPLSQLNNDLFSLLTFKCCLLRIVLLAASKRIFTKLFEITTNRC